MPKNETNALSFHNSHIKWILFTYTAFHILIAVTAICVYSCFGMLFEKYEILVYGLVVIEVVLAAECLVIRPFLKRYFRSGLNLFFLYLAIRLIINLFMAVALLFKFPHMFPDLFALIFSTTENLMNNGFSVLYAAPLFVVCISHIFLCTSSLVYYLRRRERFKR